MYLKYNKNFLADITPEKYFLLPEHSEYKECLLENKNYALAVAERIWEYESFRKTAFNLGYTETEIEETYLLCTELLKEKYLFVPLEILFAKNTAAASLQAMMKYPKIIEWLFSKHESKVKLLPEYVFKNRAVVKIMVSVNGSLLQLVPEFNADREIVTAAVKSSVYAAEFMNHSLWNDRSISEEAARHSQEALMFRYDAFKQFNDDDEIVMLALEANGANICYASERIRADYDMAVFALTHQKRTYPNCAYESLSAELRSRKDLALVELQAPEPSLKGFTEELLDDDDIAMKLIENKEITWMFCQMSERIKRKYLDKLPERIKNTIIQKLDKT